MLFDTMPFRELPRVIHLGDCVLMVLEAVGQVLELSCNCRTFTFVYFLQLDLRHQEHLSAPGKGRMSGLGCTGFCSEIGSTGYDMGQS